MLQWLDEAYTRVLAAPAVFRQFVVGLRLQNDAHTLDALSDRRRRRTARERFRCGNSCRGLQGAEKDRAARREPATAAGLRTPSTSFGLPASGSMIMPRRFRLKSVTGLPLSPKHAMIASMTRLVSSGSRTSIDRTPACLAGSRCRPGKWRRPRRSSLRWQCRGRRELSDAVGLVDAVAGTSIDVDPPRLTENSGMSGSRRA